MASLSAEMKLLSHSISVNDSPISLADPAAKKPLLTIEEDVSVGWARHVKAYAVSSLHCRLSIQSEQDRGSSSGFSTVSYFPSFPA